jgi:hypothetical protein
MRRLPFKPRAGTELARTMQSLVTNPRKGETAPLGDSSTVKAVAALPFIGNKIGAAALCIRTSANGAPQRFTRHLADGYKTARGVSTFGSDKKVPQTKRDGFAPILVPKLARDRPHLREQELALPTKCRQLRGVYIQIRGPQNR